MDIKSLIRIGTVSSVNVGACTARVVFTDVDSMVSAELPVLTQASKANKAYWLPDIDEQVLCVFLPNMSGNGASVGFILGCFYSTVDKPAETSADVRSVVFADGSVVRHDRASGDLTIHATGNINIIADGNITLNGATISLN